MCELHQITNMLCVREIAEKSLSRLLLFLTFMLIYLEYTKMIQLQGLLQYLVHFVCNKFLERHQHYWLKVMQNYFCRYHYTSLFLKSQKLLLQHSFLPQRKPCGLGHGLVFMSNEHLHLLTLLKYHLNKINIALELSQLNPSNIYTKISYFYM